MIITSDMVLSDFNYIMARHVSDPGLSYIKIDQLTKYLKVTEDKEIEDLILYYMVLLWYEGLLFSYFKKRKPVMIEYSNRAKIQNGCKICEFSMCFNYLRKNLKIKSYAAKHYILILDRQGRLTKIDLNKIFPGRRGGVLRDYLHGKI